MSAKLETYMQEVVAEGHILTNFMYIIINFLLASIFCHYEYLCDMLNPSNCLHLIPFYISPPPYLFNSAIYKFPWGSTENIPHLVGIPPHVSLFSEGLFYIYQ